MEGTIICGGWSCVDREGLQRLQGSGLLAVLESRVKAGKIILMGKWRPSLICPGEIGSDTFRGITKFKMCIYQFNFKRDGDKMLRWK